MGPQDFCGTLFLTNKMTYPKSEWLCEFSTYVNLFYCTGPSHHSRTFCPKVAAGPKRISCPKVHIWHKNAVCHFRICRQLKWRIFSQSSAIPKSTFVHVKWPKWFWDMSSIMEKRCATKFLWKRGHNVRGKRWKVLYNIYSYAASCTRSFLYTSWKLYMSPLIGCLVAWSETRGCIVTDQNIEGS